jgi:NADPH:quinone reductase-like Zn-dependent oxidoreductase
VAVNHIDWKLQDLALFPLNYPTILGQDVAGEVFGVGNSVSRFNKGDRVLGYAVRMLSKRDCEGAFQEYTVVLAHMASPIPSTLSFDRAAVVHLGLSTAAAGLFQKRYLGLQYPSMRPKPTGKTLFIWRGASTVDSNAI